MSRTCSALFAAVTAGLPSPSGARFLATELSRFTADADTVPGFLQRHHNRSVRAWYARPGVVAVTHRRNTETGSDLEGNRLLESRQNNPFDGSNLSLWLWLRMVG